ARTESPFAARIRYVFPLSDTAPPPGRLTWAPLARLLTWLLMTSRVGAVQTATVAGPMRAAIAWLTAALGQTGAPDTCRVWTTKPGPVEASWKSPEAWKS